MPITSSAKKALRASVKKGVFNTRRKEKVAKEVKNIKKLVLAGKTDDAKKALSLAYKAIDKAAKMNTLKKGTASRKKSRLSKMIKRAEKKA